MTMGLLACLLCLLECGKYVGKRDCSEGQIDRQTERSCPPARPVMHPVSPVAPPCPVEARSCRMTHPCQQVHLHYSLRRW
jgi:hypothetical protein